VKFEIGSGSSFQVRDRARYRYNALGMRALVERDANTTDGNNEINERRYLYYNAAWQIVEEHVDAEVTGSSSLTAPSIDRIVQNIWGLRYIDDLVLRRVDANYPGSGLPNFSQTAFGDIDWEQYLTDHQFSVVAAVGRTGTLAFRVAYDAFGEARHLPAKDINGDGKVDKTDTTLAQNASGKKLGQPGYNPDADWDRDGTVSTRDIAQYGSTAYVAALPQGQLAPATIVADPLSAANARSDFNIGFCGYRFNGDIGAYTVRFRHYDPTPGMCRWLERDPAGYQDGPSLYSYLGRNPMAGTDPLGLWSWGDLWDYFFRDRRAEAERTLRENQRLVEQRLGEQLQLGVINDRELREQTVAMRRDIDDVLTRMHLIALEQDERVIETQIAITISLIPVGDAAAASVNGVRALRATMTAGRAGAAGTTSATAATAGAASSIAARTTGASAETAQVTNVGRTAVYVARNEAGEVIYVGITDDLAARAASHLRQKGIRIAPLEGLERLTRADARAVEQVLIKEIGLSNLLNKINSISSKNPIYNDAIQRGTVILRSVGFPGI
jgi:RHS repeat-associated protein